MTGKNMVQVWDLSTGAEVGVKMPHPGDFYGLWSVEFSPDGNRLLTGHKDGRIRVWDWRTGQVIGSPMQNPDEVFDARFTHDGRHVLAAVRHSPLHVWDVTTGKLAVPLVGQIVPAGASSDSVSISGNRAVITAGSLFSVLDLSVLLPLPSNKLPSLLMQLELAANQELQLGELAPLEVAEWDARWNKHVASRQSPEEAALAFAKDFDQASSHERRMLIARNAARLRLLDRLLTLRPNSLELQLERISEAERTGDSITASRLTGQLLQSIRAEDVTVLPPKALASYARLMVSNLPSPDFKPIAPGTIVAESGSEFTRLPDGAILAARSETRDEYTIQCRLPGPRLTALRLETLPHESLPNGGAGWDHGNFHLTNVSAELRKLDGTRHELRFRSATSDWIRPLDETTLFRDGPTGAMDGDDTTRWDVSPKQAEPHWLILQLDQPLDIAQDEELIVRLAFKDNKYGGPVRLGCFRLSVSAEEMQPFRLELRALVEQQKLPGGDAFAAAYLCTGQIDRCLSLLETPTGDRKNPLQSILRAWALHTSGELKQARETISELAKALETQPVQRDVQGLYLHAFVEIGGFSSNEFYRLLEGRVSRRELSRLALAVAANPDALGSYLSRASYLSQLGRWNEAIEDLERCVELDPGSRLRWAQLCTTRLLANDLEGYLRDCKRMRQALADSSTAEFADSLCKISLLLPDAVDVAELPTQRLREGIDDPEWARYRDWFLACQSLVELRQGKPTEAIEWTGKMSSLNGYAGTMALVVRALSEQKLGEREQAEATLKEAEALIPEELRTLGSELYDGYLPVALSRVSTDWVIPEILRREARTLIPNEPAD